MKKIGIVTIVLIVGLFIAGCQQNSSEEASATPTEKKDLKFVIVPKVVHPWFDQVNEAAQEQAEILGEQLGVNITIDYRAPQSADVAEQNSILESAAATKPDGIAVDTLDPQGSAQVIQEIREQGIEVIFFASPPPDESGLEDLSFIGNDVYEQGEIAAERLAELLDYKGTVAVMQGVPTAPSHSERYEASKDILAKYPDITVLDGGVSNDDIQTAQQQASAVIAANPDLDGYLMSDAAAPIGISAAIKEAGKEEQITAVGIDSLNTIVENVKEGLLNSSVATKPRMQGSYIVDLLWRHSLGLEIPKAVDTGIDVVTQENVDVFLSE